VPWLACSLGGFLLALTTLGALAAEPKRVLIVHSFGNAAPPFTTHSVAFETELTGKMGERVDLDEVSLDVARYATLDMEEALVEFMRKRQAKWQPDLVVPIGSPAGVFVAQYRDRLFPKTTPIIYTGMDQRRLPAGALEQNAAFVGESFDLSGWVEDILQLAPATTNIAVVIGGSPLELYWADALRQEYQAFTNRVSFTWFSDLSFDQMLERSAKLPPHSFILLVLLMRDATGVTHNADEALKRLHEVANAPINGNFQHQLGLGIVGGRLYQGELEGVESARIAIRILHGEPASNFPPRIVGPLGPRYDWRELQRWKISQDRLPPGSVIQFREPTAWGRYKWRIVAIASLCLAEAVLIFVLLANLIKRRRAEGLLRESQDRLSAALAAGDVGVWEWNLADNRVWMTDKWREMFGFVPGEKLDFQALVGRVHEADRETVRLGAQRAAIGRTDYMAEFRAVLLDGSPRWIVIRGGFRADDDGPARMVGAMVDITERKRADEKFRLAVEASPSAIVMVNAQGQITLVNSQTEKTFGYTRAELLGEPLELLLPERHRDGHSGERRQFSAAPETRAMGQGRELFARRKDRSEFPVEIRLNPIEVDDGKFVLAAITDISDRQRTQLETQRHRQELAHVSRLSIMGELSASMAHELNQPLTAILTNAQAGQRFLAAGQSDLGEFREILNDIAHDTTRARDVIRHLRAFVKKDVREFASLDLNETIDQVIRFLHSDIVGRNGRVDLALTPGLPPVHGDRIQLQQIIVNLIINALDAMNALPPQARRVTVMTQLETPGQVRVTVRDCGPGIPANQLDKIFEPFYTSKADGLGMGLSITRSIVEAHGGRIWAENPVGGGAAFYVTVPIAAGT
jgi:PAS domain S-box-containing protein